jgi:hypothetical protein
MLRKVGVLLASLAMVLVSSLALVLVPATQAAATMPMGDGMFNGGRTYGNAPAGVGQGGHTDNYRLPEGWRIISGECIVGGDPSCFVAFRGTFGDRNCPVLPDGTQPTSYGILVSGDNGYGAFTTVHGFWCNYPPVPDVSDVYCALSVRVSAVGPRGNPTESSRTIIDTTETSAWSKTAESRKDAVLCEGTVANYNGFDFPAFGKYQLDVVKARQWCKRTDWIGGQPPLIDRCTTISRDTEPHYAQQWCGGIHQDNLDHGHNFTAEECLTDFVSVNDNRVRCNKPPVTLDGRSGDQAILDDGKGHDAVWGATVLDGTAVKSGYHLADTTVTVDNASTPFREHEPQESTKQKFQGVPSVTARLGDQQTMPDLRWFAPSLANKPPWILTRSVTVDSTLTIESKKITGVRMTPGGVFVDTENVNILVPTTVVCPSKPLQVTVNRARNFR